MLAPELWRPDLYPDSHITSLGLEGDAEARRLLRRSLREAWPAARHFGWQVGAICELDPANCDVGYTAEDGTLFVKVRDPAQGRNRFYSYSFILATLLHELTHLSVLGHGKAFYRRLVEAVAACGAEPAVRREVHAHICGELLNAVCDNDARRARALLATLPEAVDCRLPGAGNQLPLEYAAHHGRVALTKLLLEARADANATCRADGVPPLALAAARGNSKTAMVLLQAGAVRGRATLESLDSSVLAAASQSAEKPRERRWEEDGWLAARPSFEGGGGLAISRQHRRREELPREPRRAESLPALAAAPPYATKMGRRAVVLSGSLAL